MLCSNSIKFLYFRPSYGQSAATFEYSLSGVTVAVVNTHKFAAFGMLSLKQHCAILHDLALHMVNWYPHVSAGMGRYNVSILIYTHNMGIGINMYKHVQLLIKCFFVSILSMCSYVCMIWVLHLGYGLYCNQTLHDPVPSQRFP